MDSPDQKQIPNPENTLQDILDKVDVKMDAAYSEALKSPTEPSTATFGWNSMKDVKTRDEKIRKQAAIYAKYLEYNTRLQEDSDPFIPESKSAWYKREVARQLILGGEVNIWALSSAIVKTLGNIDEVKFHNSWIVIQNYVEEGGARLKGGTGLSDFSK